MVSMLEVVKLVLTISFLGLTCLLLALLCDFMGHIARQGLEWLRQAYRHARHLRQQAVQAHSVDIEVCDSGYQIVE